MINKRRQNFWKWVAVTALTIIASGSEVLAQSATFTIINQFNGADGRQPVGNLISDSVGNIYGVTNEGGKTSQCSNGCGTVFKLSKTSSGRWTRTVLHEFAGGTDGSFPGAGLVMDSHGNVYGTTQLGGVGSSGVVYELSPTESGSWKENVLHAFQGGWDGAQPYSQMVFDGMGNLYGTTSEGGTGNCGSGGSCGTVFEVSPNASGGWSETIIYNFSGNGDGWDPVGPLVFDNHGNFYGTAVMGGSSNDDCGPYYGCGEVFQLSPSSDGGWSKATVYAFQEDLNGGYPYGGVILDAEGNLYGTDSTGGRPSDCQAFQGCGLAFALRPNGKGAWTESTLFAFGDSKDDFGTSTGAFPYGSLVFGPSGYLYGTASYGGRLNNGNNAYGVIFQLSPDAEGWKETVLHVFHLSDGANPAYGLLPDGSGNLFGTTFLGGQNNGGVVFEITP